MTTEPSTTRIGGHDRPRSSGRIDQNLRGELNDAIGGLGVPGVVVGIIEADSAVDVFAVGSASLAPARPASAETVFHLFSGTKLYTATALMLLVEQGTVSRSSSCQEARGCRTTSKRSPNSCQDDGS